MQPIYYEDIVAAARRIAINHSSGKANRKKKALYYAIAFHLVNAIAIQYYTSGFVKKKIKRVYRT